MFDHHNRIRPAGTIPPVAIGDSFTRLHFRFVRACRRRARRARVSTYRGLELAGPKHIGRANRKAIEVRTIKRRHIDGRATHPPPARAKRASTTEPARRPSGSRLERRAKSRFGFVAIDHVEKLFLRGHESSESIVELKPECLGERRSDLIAHLNTFCAALRLPELLLIQKTSTSAPPEPFTVRGNDDKAIGARHRAQNRSAANCHWFGQRPSRT